MKKIITISLIAILFSCQTSYTRDAAAKYERELLGDIKKYNNKVKELNCHKFETMPQEKLNKCLIYGITLLQLEIRYSDFIQEMMADNFNMGTGLYAIKKPRNFYDE